MDEQEDFFEFEEVEPQAGPDLFGNEPEENEVEEPELFPVQEASLIEETVPVEEALVAGPAVEEILVASSVVVPAPATVPSSNRVREQEAPLALYRRYRPDNFADVIGQEHVTEPLMRALANHKINHAYLFSGPRGCGKTSSARILARCLNCEQGPTPNPCGVCQSCRELATGGSGSIDVIEMDAASHGGVNEARDLRERAFFAPVNSRFKIYIIDEAHMVTKEGFNALLKVVEEPPAHVKFIFATTEPEKVIGTIRSRTHHYPFHLVPPKTLSSFLAKICESEGVEVEDGVLGLVTRAGAGSVRDCLSVLDQLLGSAGDQGVEYETAAGLLGFTPDTLLDEISDAFAARDAKGVFDTIDKVIEVGQDPRRFAEDLLQRFRDLMIVAQVEDALSSGLLDVSQDQGERLRAQAAGFEAADLTRAASAIAQGLSDMRGTTAPRLHLELMCSRVLLPGAGAGDADLKARVEKLERFVSSGSAGGTPSSPMGSEGPSRGGSSRGGSLPRGSSARARAEEQAGVKTVGEAAVELAQEQRVQQRPVEQRPAEQRSQERPPAGQRPAEQRSPEQRLTEQRPAGQEPRFAQRPPESVAEQDSDRRSPGQVDSVQETSAPRESGVETLGQAGESFRTEPVQRQRPAQSRFEQEPPMPEWPEPDDFDDPLVRVQEPIRETPAQQRPAQQRPAQAQRPPEQRVEAAKPVVAKVPGNSGVDLEQMRKLWPAALERVKERRRFTWMQLSQNVRVFDFEASVLTLEFSNPGARESFTSSGGNEVLVDALKEVVGAELRIVSQLAGEAVSQQTRPATAEPGDTKPPVDDFDPVAEGISEYDVDLVDSTDPLELLKAEFSAEVISVEEEN